MQGMLGHQLSTAINIMTTVLCSLLQLQGSTQQQAVCSSALTVLRHLTLRVALLPLWHC